MVKRLIVRCLPRRRIACAPALALALAVMGSSALAQTTSWNATGNGTWNQNANWTNNAPTGNVTVTLGNGNLTQNPVISLNGASGNSGNITVSASTFDYTIKQDNNESLGLSVTTGTPTIDVVAANRTFTIDATLTGTQGFVKSGAGALVITANSTITGNVTLSSGTLQIGNNTARGSLTNVSNLLNNGSLVYARTDAWSATYNISGNGTLTKNSTGTLLLTGNNSYSGVTTVNAGTLQFGTTGSLYGGNSTLWTAANLNVKSGGTLGVNVGGVNEFTAGNVTTLLTNLGNSTSSTNGMNAGSNFAFSTTNAANGTFTIADVIANSGGASGGARGLIKRGTGTLILTSNNTYTAGTLINNGTLQIGNGGTSGSIATTSGVTNNGSLTYNRSNDITAGYVVSGTGTVTKNGSGTLIFSSNNTYTGNTTVNAGTLQIGNGGTSGSIASTNGLTNNSVLAYNRSDNLTVPYVISGSGRLEKLGPNTLIVTGANSYTGNTTISAGTLQIGNGTSGSIASTAGVINNSALAYNRNDALTVPYVISGNGTVTKLGTGTTTITGNNTYTGITTISAGTLQLGNGGTTGTIASTAAVVNNGNLIFNRSGTQTAGYAISGNGTVSKIGTSTLTLTGNSTYTGATTISAGTLQIGNGGTSGSIAGTVSVTNNAALIYNRSDALSVPYSVSGSGSLSQSGTGTTTLTANNSYSGQTIVNAGTLQFTTTGSLYNANAANWTAANINVKSGATLGLNVGGTNEFSTANVTTLLTNLASSSSSTNGMLAGSNFAFSTTNASGGTFTINDVIANSGGATGGSRGVVKRGTGTLVLTANNTYNGTTAINNGTLQIGNGGTTGSIANTASVTNNGSLVYNRSDVITAGYAINGNGTLTKHGGGSLILTGNNGYTGATVISTGTLQIGNGSTTGSIASTASVTNNAALVYNRSDAITAGYTISGTGTLRKEGAGTLILTGNNTYNGTTTINAGSLQIGNGGTSGSIGGTASVTNNASLLYNRSDSITANYVINGTGSLTQIGPGTLVLGGNNTYSGASRIRNGTVEVGQDSLSGTAGAFGNATSAIVLGTSNTGAGNARLLINGAHAVGRAISVGSESNGGIGYSAVIGGSNTTGTSTFSGNITLGTTATNYTATLQAATGGTVEFTGGTWTTNNKQIQVGSADNEGVVKISNVVSTTGGFAVSAGTLEFSSGTLGAVGNIAFTGNSTLRWASGNTQDVSTRIVMTNGITSNFNTNGNNVTLASAFGNATTGILTKRGNGVLTLSANNTFSGGAVVNGGTLRANNTPGGGSSATGSGAVTVDAGGTFDGNGAVSGPVTVNNLGTLSPGVGIESLSAGAVTFNTGSTFKVAVDRDASLSSGADLQVVNGNLSLFGIVNLDFERLGTATPFAINTTFSVANYSGSWNGGLFRVGGVDIANGGTFSDGVNTWQLTYNGTSGGSNFSSEYLPMSSFVNIVAVPEPPVVALLAAAGLGFTVIRRRRRRVN